MYRKGIRTTTPDMTYSSTVRGFAQPSDPLTVERVLAGGSGGGVKPFLCPPFLIVMEQQSHSAFCQTD